MSFRVKKIVSIEQKQAFHDLPKHLYKENSYWRPPFQHEVENIFNENKNERFQKGGECERFLVYNGDKVIGRFALFSDPEKDETYKPKLGGIGFIEMEEDARIIQLIIGHANKWHQKRGNAGFRGPINFGENDMFWGIQTSGFKDSNIYGMLYHQPYYQRLIEQTDAEKFDDLYMYQLELDADIPERFAKIAERIKYNSSIEIRPIDVKNLQRDGEYIRTIYNRAFHNQVVKEREEEFIGISRETIRQMTKKLKPVLMPETSPIAFVNGEPASFLISVPDLHEISAQTQGQLKWWHYLKMFGFKNRVEKLRPLAFGTDPGFRGRGLEALIFVEGVKWTRENYPNLKLMEGGFVSEKNWIMRRSLEALGCEVEKTYRVYKWMVN